MKYNTQKNILWSLKSQKISSFYINFNKLNLENFQALFLNNFELGNTYSMLIRGEFDEGSKYRMMGTQIGFTLNQDNYLIIINSLYDKLMNRLDEFLENYKIDELDSVQVLFVKVKSLPNLQLKNINDIGFPKHLINVKEVKSKYNYKFLPLTVNTDYFGRLIRDSDCKQYIDIISSQSNIIFKDSEYKLEFDSMHLFNDKYIILSTKLDNGTIHRNIYDAKLGVFEAKFIDYIINDTTFERKYKSTIFTISNDKLIMMSITKELSVLNSDSIEHVHKKQVLVSNPFIGSFDLEAFEDSDGYAKVYAAGFCVLSDNTVKFYKDNDEQDVLLECINAMLVKKYSGFTFYVHNLNYDGVFILNKLKVFNEINDKEYYKINTLYKDSSILKIEVSIKDIKIIFVDSSNLLKGKLRKLCESFGLSTQKGNFPYKFVNKDTLHYIGDTPSYNYWINLTDNDFSEDEYKKLLKPNWSLKDECLLYLEKDLVSLLELMNLFNKYIYQKFGLQVTDNLTISRLSLNIFIKNYLNDSIIPSVRGSLYDDIKKSYYGGITEVYKPYGENLLYYDVNSLYPYAALNPMCGNKYTYMEKFDGYLNLKDLFGFFYCEIETNSNYLGLLPVRRREGLVMPNGKWTGWYFSEELKFASDNGYNIKVIKGYNFNKKFNIFDNYINYLYNIKSTTTNLVEKSIMKSLLNNLLGRFGLNINKPKTEIVNLDKLDLLISTRECNSFKKISENSYLISYYPKISKVVCEMHGLDYAEVLKEVKSEVNLDNQSGSDKFNDVSIVISAAITAYARIYMSKVKLDILNKGGNIYYTDTDSIVTDIPLNNVGNKLGEFKLEHKVKKGYFVSAKTYGLILENNKTLCKSKGVVENGLSIEDCIKLYHGLNVEVPKVSAIRNYAKGSVLIKSDTIKLDYDSYKKRIKIFDENSKWVDTKPLIIEGDNLIENNNNNNESIEITRTKKKKFKYLRVFFYFSYGLYNILYKIILMLISLLLVCLFGDFLDINHNIPNKLETLVYNKLDTETFIHKDKPLISSYLKDNKYNSLLDFNKKRRSYYLECVYKNIIHELLSKCILETKFTNQDSLIEYSKNYILKEMEIGHLRITTSEYFEIINKVSKIKDNNSELYEMLHSKIKPRYSKDVKYNIISKKWETSYQNWTQNPYEYSQVENMTIKNELSLLDELEKINSNYTYLLGEYSEIKNQIDSKCIPRSHNNISLNSTDNIINKSEIKI